MDSMGMPTESHLTRILLRECVENLDRIEESLRDGDFTTADRLLRDTHAKLGEANGLMARQNPKILRAIS